MAIPWLLNLYGGVAAIAFLVYLTLFLSDRETPITDVKSWMVLLIATFLWPITLPVSLQKELLPRWRGQWFQWFSSDSFPDIPTTHDTEAHQRGSQFDTSQFEASKFDPAKFEAMESSES